VEAGLIQRRGGIEPGHLRHGYQQISAATAEVQSQCGGSPGSRLGVIEVAVRGAAGDAVKDRSRKTAREASPEPSVTLLMSSGQKLIPRSRCARRRWPGQGQCDRSAGSRLPAEGGFLDQRNGGRNGHGETIGQRAALVVGMVTVTLRVATVAVELMVMWR